MALRPLLPPLLLAGHLFAGLLGLLSLLPDLQLMCLANLALQNELEEV